MSPVAVRPGRGTVAAMWLTAALSAGGVLGGRLFLWPYTPAPNPANAVVVLSGDYGDRLRKGLMLVGAGVAPTLVLAGEPDSDAADRLCTESRPFEVICLRPEPDSTRAEARATAQLAADRGWSGVVVVTSRSHVTRAGLLFRRCVAGTVTMVASRPSYGLPAQIGAVTHEALGLTQALALRRPC